MCLQCIRKLVMCERAPRKGVKMESVIFSGIDMTDKVEKAYPDGAQQYKSRALTGNTKIADGNNAIKTARTEAVSFRECMDDAIRKETAVFPSGEDVVMANPPVYRTSYNVDMGKAREEMTLDEYKQYICNKVSALPVSDSKRVCSSGVLIFKEEAFEKMKSDTAYEEEVLQMLEERFSAQLSVYEPNVEYQVIGASKEDCYGAAIPLKSYGWMSGLQNGLVSSAVSTGKSIGFPVSPAMLWANNLSALGLPSYGLSAEGLSGLGLSSTGLWADGLSGLGLSSYNLSGLGVASSGLWPGSLSGLNLSRTKAAALGASYRNAGDWQGLSGAVNAGGSRSGMINAYRNVAKNKRNSSYTNSSSRKWRV